MTIGLTWRRTARRFKRLKETVLAISPDYSDRPTPDLLTLSSKCFRSSRINARANERIVSRPHDDPAGLRPARGFVKIHPRRRLFAGSLVDVVNSLPHCFNGVFNNRYLGKTIDQLSALMRILVSIFLYCDNALPD